MDFLELVTQRRNSKEREVTYFLPEFFGHKMTDVRVCHPYDLKFVLEHIRGIKFSGLLSPIVHSLLKLISRDNVTLSIQDLERTSEPIGTSGHFTGCIGQLQSNSSDILLLLADYPLNAANITQGDVATDSVTQFVSFYYSSNDHFAGQVLSCFESLKLDTCLLALLWLLTLCFLLEMRSLVHRALFSQILGIQHWMLPRRSNRYYFYRIVTHMSRVASMNQNGLFNRIVFIFNSIFALLVVQYFLIWMKTDLVVIENPNIFKRYQDLIDNQVSIFFYKGFNLENQFRDAPVGSKEKFLWNFSVKTIGDQIVCDQGDERIMDLNKLSIRRKAALIMDDHQSPSLLINSCKLKDALMHFVEEVARLGLDAEITFPFVSQDPKAGTVQKGVIFSEFFVGSIYRNIRRRLVTFNEVGLTFYSVTFFKALDTLSHSMKVDPPKSERAKKRLKDCMSNKVVKAGHKTDQLMMANFRTLYYTFWSLVLFAGFICIIEVWNFRFLDSISKERMY